jgi:hypothetical protein
MPQAKLYRRTFRRITIAPLRYERRHLSRTWWTKKPGGQGTTIVELFGILQASQLVFFVQVAGSAGFLLQAH